MVEGLNPTLYALSASFQGADICWKGTCDFCDCHPDGISRSPGSGSWDLHLWSIYIYILWKLLPEGLASNQPESGCWLSPSLRHWQVLTNPQLLGATKNKLLEQSQRFEKQQRARARLNNKVLSYKRPLPQDCERWLFYAWKQTQKIKENKETEKNVPNRTR